ncbi:MAG: peptidoglycan DD-metalloendopeptidase family protein [Bacteroidetes bacterium]|nr:peptidoglycan DD-metalloendopeptidase family protein [Bacteroidota bacterium]MBP7255988.1 peptidoglycan DD-metalloendopeptidase family protein [Chitinophagales bacterium]MBK7503940.1 peptidoglycan DD-metalloendopeptidase family protein [Bacteroidota bacterium]MBK7638975.1 peptidoglycan DD-metalloendopeptidase family protein [Bacteroidota bacterium]MBK8673994.1 peptidoglycan DD-metalloendopeptidase family protein [Bacteroidota bacterium]
MYTKIILFFSFFVCIGAFGQSKKTLEDKRKKLLTEIKTTQKQLVQTKEKQEASINELSVLEKKITLREDLILNTTGEVILFNNQIQSKGDNIRLLESELQVLRKEFKKTVLTSYKNFRVKNQILFLVSSKNFSDAMRRFNYLKKYSSFRRIQAEKIKHTKLKIARSVQEIDNRKKTKQQLLDEQTLQKRLLSNEKTQKQKLVETLRSKEKELAGTLVNKQKEADKLNGQIEDIIKKEIQLAKQKEIELAKQKEIAKQKEAEKLKNQTANIPAPKPTPDKSNTNTNKPSTTPKPISNKPIESTPEVQNNSAGFYTNKGKLPWPVEKGFIIKGFGSYTHPDLKDVKFENNGIDIKTEQGATVRCIYEGKVVGVISNPLFKNAVIVSHGDYYTVYSKMDQVFVSKGDKISLKQSIGKAFTDTDTQSTEVHLEVWKGEVKLNPTDWILRK